MSHVHDDSMNVLTTDCHLIWDGEEKVKKRSNRFLWAHQRCAPLSLQVTEELTPDTNNQLQMSRRRKTRQEHRSADTGCLWFLSWPLVTIPLFSCFLSRSGFQVNRADETRGPSSQKLCHGLKSVDGIVRNRMGKKQTLLTMGFWGD